ncbi:MAG: RNA polymerase sporulation sigma factor SigG [Christensenellales bacterium]|jgi:RNA polymerase sporulation-specific sigma factor
MQPNKVEICGVDTSTLPTLKKDQMDALMKRVKAGDKAAREEFVFGNLRLVLSVIQRFQNRGEQLDDIFQVGCIGLLKAVDNFDPENYNVRFSTYAVPMIMGEIRRYLRDNNAVRVSRSLRDTAYRALQARTNLMNTSMREPTMAEIARELGMEEDDVSYALDAIQDPVSLFEPIFHDGSDAIYVMDQVKDSTESEEKWLSGIAISEGLNKLNEREQRILKMRFLDGRTQMEVANEIGLSQSEMQLTFPKKMRFSFPRGRGGTALSCLAVVHAEL